MSKVVLILEKVDPEFARRRQLVHEFYKQKPDDARPRSSDGLTVDTEARDPKLRPISAPSWREAAHRIVRPPRPKIVHPPPMREWSVLPISDAPVSSKHRLPGSISISVPETPRLISSKVFRPPHNPPIPRSNSVTDGTISKRSSMFMSQQAENGKSPGKIGIASRRLEDRQAGVSTKEALSATLEKDPPTPIPVSGPASRRSSRNYFEESSVSPSLPDPADSLIATEHGSTFTVAGYVDDQQKSLSVISGHITEREEFFNSALKDRTGSRQSTYSPCDNEENISLSLSSLHDIQTDRDTPPDTSQPRSIPNPLIPIPSVNQRKCERVFIPSPSPSNEVTHPRKRRRAKSEGDQDISVLSPSDNLRTRRNREGINRRAQNMTAQKRYREKKRMREQQVSQPNR